jgi:methylmalonyl-CoA mutase cobalamin-binding subunit
MKDNHDVVLAAVQQNGSALGYASAAMKDKHDVVLAAVQQNGNALQFASFAMQHKHELKQAAEAAKKVKACVYFVNLLEPTVVSVA